MFCRCTCSRKRRGLCSPKDSGNAISSRDSVTVSGTAVEPSMKRDLRGLEAQTICQVSLIATFGRTADAREGRISVVQRRRRLATGAMKGTVPPYGPSPLRAPSNRRDVEILAAMAFATAALSFSPGKPGGLTNLPSCSGMGALMPNASITKWR